VREGFAGEIPVSFAGQRHRRKAKTVYFRGNALSGILSELRRPSHNGCHGSKILDKASFYICL